MNDSPLYFQIFFIELYSCLLKQCVCVLAMCHICWEESCELVAGSAEERLGEEEACW